MATITKFEDLEIWKAAQNIASSVYKLCDANVKISKDFSFKDQIKRASLSISNNIAEGFEYSNNNDFNRFLRIAKGSCGEVKNCLLFSIRVGFTNEVDIENIIEDCTTLGNKIGKLMKYLKEIKMAKGNTTRNPKQNNS